jgi:tRNA threonylcarbamoyladenosine biosynthesis protein TsaB
MKLLALDTSTDTLFLALSDGQNLLTYTGAGAAQSSATLIPQAMALLDQAGWRPQQLEAVVFGRGPGSFTGVRTACAVAQGLAFGAGCPVLPVDTLMAVAEEARHQQGATRVAALLDARMDEIYAACYVFDGKLWRLDGGYSLNKPEKWQPPTGDWLLAGNVFEGVGAAMGARLQTPGEQCQVLPTATALLRVAPGLIAEGGAVPAEQALPLYIRDKVAQTTAEREADRQRQAQGAA